MAILISVSKSVLNNNQELSHQLTQLSKEIKEVANNCIYIPAPGNVMEMIRLLDSYKIAFGIHADTEFPPFLQNID